VIGFGAGLNHKLVMEYLAMALGSLESNVSVHPDKSAPVKENGK
jgi:hypothetical protein